MILFHRAEQGWAGRGRTGQDSASRATCQWVSSARLACLPLPRPSLPPAQPSLTPRLHSTTPPRQAGRLTSRGRHPSEWLLPGLAAEAPSCWLLQLPTPRAYNVYVAIACAGGEFHRHRASAELVALAQAPAPRNRPQPPSLPHLPVAVLHP
jgi:hypothetical protein